MKDSKEKKLLEDFHLPFTKLKIGRFLFLLISIVLMFTLRPFLEGFIRIGILVDIFATLILLSGICIGF